MKYYLITVYTDHESSELAADVMYEATGGGVSIADREDLSVQNWDYAEAGLIDKFPKEVKVTCCAPEDGLDWVLAKLKNGFAAYGLGELKTEFRLTDDAEWKDEWKKNYFPVNIGAVTVCPAWLDDGDEKNVLIDTGLAFGTGQHETTALAAELLQAVETRGKRVLDVGCGSGVLGLIAAKLGASEVVFTDNDPQAAETAQKNVALNGFKAETRVVCSDLAENTEGKFDIILANLTAPILLTLESRIDGVLKKGSKLILSGILNSCSAGVENGFGRFRLIEKRVKGEWTALLYEV